MPAASALAFRIARSARKKVITVGNKTMKVTTAAFGKIITLPPSVAQVSPSASRPAARR